MPRLHELGYPPHGIAHALYFALMGADAQCPLGPRERCPSCLFFSSEGSMENEAPPLPGRGQHVPASEIAAFIRREEIELLLRPFLPDAGECGMVVRCLLDVGPAHHRGSNYILLRLLGLLLTRVAERPAPQPQAHCAAIPLRVPPLLQSKEEPKTYPLGIPLPVLERLAPRESRQLAAMLDCLSDGPPQHSLANATMLHLLDVLLRASDAAASGREP